jgi:Ca-activated chloride channel family protein
MGEFLDSLKSIPNLELALRCYGHQTFIKPTRNCKDTKLEIPFAPAVKSAALIKQRIQKLEPRGTTPIAYSLGESATDFTPCNNCRNIIIFITEGFRLIKNYFIIIAHKFLNLHGRHSFSEYF